MSGGCCGLPGLLGTVQYLRSQRADLRRHGRVELRQVGVQERGQAGAARGPHRLECGQLANEQRLAALRPGRLDLRVEDVRVGTVWHGDPLVKPSAGPDVDAEHARDVVAARVPAGDARDVAGVHPDGLARGHIFQTAVDVAVDHRVDAGDLA